LRRQAAEVIALISQKYRLYLFSNLTSHLVSNEKWIDSVLSPDLYPRLCKTYLEAITQKKSWNVAYGGVVGISALGPAVVRSLLLDNLGALKELISTTQVSTDTSGKIVNTADDLEMLKDAVCQALGSLEYRYFSRLDFSYRR
jgi:hypothetical protein